MSLKILRAGIFDTVQDSGRFGYQHLGINPGGVMDVYAAQLANALLGKDMSSAVLELHFPASEILFEQPAIICITGAQFSPVINNVPIPVNRPVAVAKNAVLKFKKATWGARAYLSVYPGFAITPWLNSASTNVKAEAGGFAGRKLQKEDVLPFDKKPGFFAMDDKAFFVLPWHGTGIEYKNELQYLMGNEWHCLTEEAKTIFQHHPFRLTRQCDRMGYRLMGKDLKVNESESLVSTPVNFGTIQLLPDGQLILLMADHQTTGGYPRIAHVISAHLPFAAQLKPNDILHFSLVELVDAEQLFLEQQKKLEHLQIACKFQIENILT